ncbi:MAG: acetyl-CoA carboxylase biotin carboxyl carrier protein [Fusobacteriaceae bacterium]
MKISLDVVKDLAKSVNAHKLNEISLESHGVKVVLKRELNVAPQVVTTQVVQSAAPVQTISQGQVQMTETISAVTPAVEGEAIESPMVGTFYASPAPGAESFVKEGQKVKKGDTVCIVEAMKLMNEVKAAKDCKIEKILMTSGTPLKKGDKIFIIS